MLTAAIVIVATTMAAANAGTLTDAAPRAETPIESTPPPTTTTPPADTQSTPPAPLASRSITIDAGHNGGNASHPSRIYRMVWAGNRYKHCDEVGAATNSGYPEHAFNFDVARRLKAILESRGAKVTMTRTSNTGWGPCITKRARIGNRNSEIAISIHADGGPAKGRGFHVIFPRRIPKLTGDIVVESKAFAIRTRDALHAIGLPYATYVGTKGLDKRNDLGGLNLSNIPKIFVELGNMRNPRDARLLKRKRYRQKLATALANALQEQLCATTPCP